MRLLLWNSVIVVWMATGLFTPWAVALDPGPVELAGVAEPGLCGMFSKLEVGSKEIDGIPFVMNDARVPVRAGEKKRIDFAPVVCAGLHFLHFTENGGDQIGSYGLIYADGERAEIPLRSGLNINDWWKPGAIAFASQAHADMLQHDRGPQQIGFWRFSVRNPRPEAPLTAVEVANTDTVVTINLIALTLTAECPDVIADVPVWVEGMDEEVFFLAVLGQPGAVAGKEKACEQLRRVGTLKSVPALAACLSDEHLGPAARLALAAMPYPEARAAVREGLNTTSGPIKAGIIETIGAWRDPADAPLVAPCLNDGDPLVAMSAALALGRMGGADAVAALKAAAEAGAARQRAVSVDGLLHCAEILGDSNTGAAHALYSQIVERWGTGDAGTAAYLGMIRTGGPEADDLITKALLSEDPMLWNAALVAVREPGTAATVTQACAELAGQVPRGVLPGLIEALAQRGERAAAPALIGLIEDDAPEIAASAVRALAQVGDESAVPALVNAAAHGDEAVRPVAMETLAQLNAAGVAEALVSRLKGADGAEATVLAKTLGQRREAASVPALRSLVSGEDAGVRVAAVQALAEVGDAKDAALLCEMVVKAQDDKERAAATRALVALGDRLATPPEFVEAVLAGVHGDDVALRCAMLGVCGRLRHPEFLKALDGAKDDANAVVKDAAVRALAGSEDPDALPCLLALLDTATDPAHRVFAFRGIARLTGSATGVDEAAREDSLLRAIALAKSPEEKRSILSALGGCPTLGTMKAVEAEFGSPDVIEEAIAAWGQIARALAPTHSNEVSEGLAFVLAAADKAGVSKDAMPGVTAVMKALAAAPVPGDRVRFERVALDRQFRAEGVAVADVNRDGKSDVLAGDVWYAAPDWRMRELRPTQAYDGNTGYSQCFANFAMDVDEDGWTDSIIIGMPGEAAHWYRNPGEAEGHWQPYLLATSACGETPIFGDLLGDGKPVPVFGMNNRGTWFRTGQDKLAPWLAFPVSHQMASFERFGHGLGMGDVNGDGKTDLVSTEGWWEAPEDRTRPDWGFHQAALGPACANMLVYDVDGDGDSDIITSSAHEYGVWWFEQRQENGATTFTQHEIHKGMSQTHALILADMNNDGLLDLVTGKRYFAHCGNDPGAHEPALLIWFELQRPEPGKVEYRMHEIDNDSGVGTQFEVCDFDDDGLLDVVTSNKKGVHLFLQRRDK